MSTETTPLERLGRLPEPMQAALLEFAVAMIDTDTDDKSAVMFHADVNMLTGNAAVMRVAEATKRVMDAVVLQIKVGRARSVLQALTDDLRTAGGVR